MNLRINILEVALFSLRFREINIHAQIQLQIHLFYFDRTPVYHTKSGLFCIVLLVVVVVRGRIFCEGRSLSWKVE